MSADLEGGERLRAKLQALGLGVSLAARKEVLRGALNVQAGAKRRCPVKTGRLRNSIAVEMIGSGMEAHVGTNVHYAPMVEFGTRRMAARPYLFPALEEERPKLAARLGKLIEDEARRRGRGK